VRTEHANYFEALEKHPRLLIGTEVPAIGKEGMERLRDADDAKDWQEAVKSLLVAEVRSRASKSMDESADFLTTVHASIELFQNNADLIPGTKDFDVELANRFTTMAEPYELRVDEKLQGYSIPVQPIIDQLRTQIAAERTRAASAAPAAPAAAGGPAAGATASTPGTPAAAAAAPAEAPQAGIPSRAGNSSESEDFSALFGTIGLPNLQI
jgi:hypothetical protein